MWKHISVHTAHPNQQMSCVVSWCYTGYWQGTNEMGQQSHLTKEGCISISHVTAQPAQPHKDWYDTRLSRRLHLYNRAAAEVKKKKVAQIKTVQGICRGQVTQNVNEKCGRPANGRDCFTCSLSLWVLMQVPIYIFWGRITHLYDFFHII